MADRKNDAPPAAPPAAPRPRSAQRVPEATGGVELSPEDIKQAAKLEHLGACVGGRVTTFRFADEPDVQVVRCPDCGAINREQRG